MDDRFLSDECDRNEISFPLYVKKKAYSFTRMAFADLAYRSVIVTIIRAIDLMLNKILMPAYSSYLKKMPRPYSKSDKVDKFNKNSVTSGEGTGKVATIVAANGAYGFNLL